jgi:hypothetical protein
MDKVITIPSGHEVDLRFDWVDYERMFVGARLRWGKIKLGGIVLFRGHGYDRPHHDYWYANPAEKAEAARYYREKFPDLASADDETLFKEGFAREADLGPIVEKAREHMAAINQEGKRLYLAIDAEGRIVGHGYKATYAYESATRNGWTGWFSRHGADNETLWLVPVDMVRVAVVD